MIIIIIIWALGIPDKVLFCLKLLSLQVQLLGFLQQRVNAPLLSWVRKLAEWQQLIQSVRPVARAAPLMLCINLGLKITASKLPQPLLPYICTVSTAEACVSFSVFVALFLQLRPILLPGHLWDPYASSSIAIYLLPLSSEMTLPKDWLSTGW